MSYDRIIRDALRLARSPRRFALGGEADPKDISPSISNPVSVFPKPQRMFPSDAPVPGGQYLGMPDKQDMTGHKSAVASIGVNPGGKPYFNASRDAVDQTGTAGKAKTKTNLFKQKAGWSWQTAPEGYEDTNTIVSVEHRGKHYYTLNAHFPKGVDFARYAESKSEPRLRPTTTGDVFLGPQAGTISVRGKEHPVYHHVVVKADGGAVGYASGGDVDQPRKLDDMGFYSSAAESARSLPQSKGTPQQMLATMKGVKPAELEWSGVQDKFAGQKSVTKDDLAQHFEQNVPQIRETVLGGGINPEIIKKRTEIKDMYWPEISRLQNIAMPFAIEAQSATKEYEDKINELRNRMVEDITKEVGFTKEKSQELVNDFKDHIVINQYPEEVKNVNAIKEKINNALENKRIESLKVEEVKRLMHEHMDSEAPLPNLEPTKYQDYTVGGIQKDGFRSQRNYREVLLHLPGERKFQSSHWDPANIVTHLRMQDRGPNNNILHLEELQSDWAQQGREKGFDTKDMKEKRESAISEFDNYSKNLADKYGLNPRQNLAMYARIKNMSDDEVSKYENLQREVSRLGGFYNNYIEPSPYVTNTDHWVELGLKRALLEAARGGYDKLVWTPGEEQAKRFDLSRHVDRVEYNPYNKKFNAYKDGNKVIAERGVEQDKIKNYIGSELAEKLNNKIKNQMAEDSDLIARVNNLITKDTNVDMLYDSLSSRYGLEGLDLKVGGEGMKSFYDKMLPSALRRVLKPHTDKIQPTSHVVKGNDGEDVTLPGIEITPELRESILKRGFSYYARGGEVRQHFEDGGGADSGGGDGYGGSESGSPAGDTGGFMGDTTGMDTAPAPSNVGYSAQDENAPPPNVTQQNPYSHFEGVPVLESVEKSITTGPGLVGAIAGSPLGALAYGMEAINNAYYDGKARADIDPNAGGPGGQESGFAPPQPPNAPGSGFRLSNDDEETQAGMVKPVGFAPPPAPMMARGGVPRNSHTALSIPGVHIREEIHGRPIFLGERDV